MLIPRPSRARDLVTMAEVGSARLTSLERVTTGIRVPDRFPGALGRNLTLSQQIAATLDLVLWFP